MLSTKRSPILIKNTAHGFTLIELLLYVAISSIILLAISAFLSTLLESRVKNQTIAEVEQQGAQVMQTVTQAVRNADLINSPAAGASAATLSINTYVGGNNPTLVDLSSGVIRMTEGVGSPVALTNSRITASALTFQNLSRASTPGIIRVSFILTQINSSGRNEYNFSKTFNASASLRQP